VHSDAPLLRSCDRLALWDSLHSYAPSLGSCDRLALWDSLHSYAPSLGNCDICFFLRGNQFGLEIVDRTHVDKFHLFKCSGILGADHILSMEIGEDSSKMLADIALNDFSSLTIIRFHLVELALMIFVGL